jgi:hypothetical protein
MGNGYSLSVNGPGNSTSFGQSNSLDTARFSITLIWMPVRLRSGFSFVISAVLLTVGVRGEPVKKVDPPTHNAMADKVVGGKPPVARVKIVKDTYFGETVEDPYRWMENDKDPGWLPFLKAENDYTRKVLDNVPGRDALLKRIEQLSGDTVQTNRLQRAHGRLFFQQRPIGADNFKLFVREDPFDKLRAGSRDGAVES